MFKKQLFDAKVLFFASALALLLAFGTGMGQVRFDDPINLSNDPTDSANPNITAVNDQVFVFWRNILLGGSEIRLAHSKDKGRTFRTWNLSSGIQESGRPEVVADGDNIYVGWGGYVRWPNVSTAAPFLARSNDGGETFSLPFDLSGRGALGAPTMNIQNDLLNVAWHGYDQKSGFLDTLFSKSTDFGQTFSEPMIVSDLSLRGGVGSDPVLASDGDQVYLAWLGARRGLSFYDIVFAHSTDGGQHFSQPVALSNRSREGEMAVNPQLAVGGQGYIYMVWTQGLYSPFDPLLLSIYFSRSTDGGESFSRPVNFSNNPESGLGVRLAAAGDNLYIVANSAGNVFFWRSTDGGDTFDERQNVSRSPRGAGNAQIAVREKGALLDQGITEDVIYIVWQDDRMGHSQVFFSVSMDGGVTFSEPENISNNPRASVGPRIAAVGRNVYVTWMDNVARNWDAFFIRGRLESEAKGR